MKDITLKPNTQGGSCCSGSSSPATASCCGTGGTKEQVKTEQNQSNSLEIEFMYLDLSLCDRCQDTDNNLEEALEDVAKVLITAGKEVTLRKIHIQSAEQAKELGFMSSPTIRLNGWDIQLEVKENTCASCGDLCGEDVECRVWLYQGKEYSAPPKGMIIEAILKEVFGGTNRLQERPARSEDIPDNLKKFFASMEASGKVKKP